MQCVLTSTSFYGFPDHFYTAQYPSKGSPELASKVMVMLSEAGIQTFGVERGLDHGVWSGFSVGESSKHPRNRSATRQLTASPAFDPQTNPLGVPLVQVSLFKSESPRDHYTLGRAVSRLRDEGVVIIGAGMTVHNLRDMHVMSAGNTAPLPYAVTFDDAVKAAVEVDPSVREERMAEVCGRPDARQAHPFMDHLMPLFIAAGAAHDDWGRQTWTMQEGSFGWAQYRFGDLPRP